jgi:hypothetical protein
LSAAIEARFGPVVPLVAAYAVVVGLLTLVIVD